MEAPPYTNRMPKIRAKSPLAYTRCHAKAEFCFRIPKLHLARMT
jgi:hypothetical protein